MRTLMGAGLAGVLLLGTAGMAWAGPLPQSQTVTHSQTTNWTSTLDFTGASVPVGDHLTGVTIKVSEDLNGIVTIANAANASSAATGTVDQIDTVIFTIPGQSQTSFSNDGGTQSVNVPIGGSVPYDFSKTASNSYTISSDLSAFTTAWGLPVTVNDNVLTGLSGGNTTSTKTNIGGLSVTATYDFAANTTVAEPFSMAMLASGLLSLALVRRRRRS